jgi:hypothetical protein
MSAIGSSPNLGGVAYGFIYKIWINRPVGQTELIEVSRSIGGKTRDHRRKIRKNSTQNGLHLFGPEAQLNIISETIHDRLNIR